MGFFHRKGKQLKTKQDLREWWEQQTTDDAPRTATAQKTTTTSPDQATESRLHDKGQDGQDENDVNRDNVGQSNKAHTVADAHDEDKGNTVTASDEATATEDSNSTTEATAPHVDAATEDVESTDDATATTKNVEPARGTDSDKAATVDEKTRSQTTHDEPDGVEPHDVEWESADIPATPVTDAVAGRSSEIPHLEVSTVSADEADAASSITSMFGAQVSNAAQGTEQPADDEVTES